MDRAVGRYEDDNDDKDDNDEKEEGIEVGGPLWTLPRFSPLFSPPSPPRTSPSPFGSDDSGGSTRETGRYDFACRFSAV